MIPAFLPSLSISLVTPYGTRDIGMRIVPAALPRAGTHPAPLQTALPRRQSPPHRPYLPPMPRHGPRHLHEPNPGRNVSDNPQVARSSRTRELPEVGPQTAQQPAEGKSA